MCRRFDIQVPSNKFEVNLVQEILLMENSTASVKKIHVAFLKISKRNVRQEFTEFTVFWVEMP
jgi:hypothetical protein